MQIVGAVGGQVHILTITGSFLFYIEERETEVGGRVGF